MAANQLLLYAHRRAHGRDAAARAATPTRRAAVDALEAHYVAAARALLPDDPGRECFGPRALAAVALFTLGMVAPLAHAAWDNHQPSEYRGTAISADCALCESLAARMDDGAPLQSAFSALVPLAGARALVSMPSQPVFIGAQLGLRPSRAPPLHA